MTPHLTDFIFTQHSIDLLYGFIREQNTPYFAQIEEKMQRTYEINEDLIPNISVVNPYDFYNDVLIPKHTEENVNNKRGHLTLLGDREHQNEYFPEYIEVMNRDHKLSEIVDNIARSNPHDMNFIYVLTCRPFYYQDEEINNYHLFRGIVPNSGTVNNQPVANHNAPLGGLINKYISTPFQPAAPGQFPPAAPPGQFPFAHAPINNNKMEGLINYVGTHNPTPNSLHDLLSQLPMSQ